MPYFSVKCWKYGIGNYKTITVKAYSKEDAKNLVKSEYGWTAVGAREVAFDNKNRKYIVPTTGRTHREEVESEKKENREVKNFVVTFVSNKDGKTKTTVVKATDARMAKAQVAQFGKATKAEVAKGKGKTSKPAQYKSFKDRGCKMVKGLEVYPTTQEEIEEAVERTKGWTSSYIERAGSVKSGMTKV